MEAIATRVEAIAARVEGIVLVGWRPSLLGWMVLACLFRLPNKQIQGGRMVVWSLLAVLLIISGVLLQAGRFL